MSIFKDTILIPDIVADGACDRRERPRAFYSQRLVDLAEERYKSDPSFRTLMQGAAKRRNPALSRDADEAAAILARDSLNRYMDVLMDEMLTITIQQIEDRANRDHKYGRPAYRASRDPNPHPPRASDTWEEALKSGQEYMVGDKYPIETFVRDHRSSVTAWQKMAFLWAFANPTEELTLLNDQFHWNIRARGAEGLYYIQYRLPHQDRGGEKTYISRDGKTKILVDRD